jgi:hypothetical protein
MANSVTYEEQTEAFARCACALGERTSALRQRSAIGFP